MLIGVPKEIKNHEYRVGLTPESVGEFIAHGHKVIVETNAGSGIEQFAKSRTRSPITSEKRSKQYMMDRLAISVN